MLFNVHVQLVKRYLDTVFDKCRANLFVEVEVDVPILVSLAPSSDKYYDGTRAMFFHHDKQRQLVKYSLVSVKDLFDKLL